jgi:hypothetical protein
MSIVLVVAVRILEGMFIVGAVGCTAVLALTAVEDLRTLFGKDDDSIERVSQDSTHRP